MLSTPATNRGRAPVAHRTRLLGNITPSPSCTPAVSSGVAKLKDTLTAHSWTTKSSLFPTAVALPEPPRGAYAISAKTRTMKTAGQRHCPKISKRTIPALLPTTPRPKNFLLAGSDSARSPLIVSRFKKRYSVDVQKSSAPKIPYRDVPRGKSRRQGRHISRPEATASSAIAWIRLEPLPRCGKFEFANEVFADAIPRNSSTTPPLKREMSKPPKGYLAAIRWSISVVVYALVSRRGLRQKSFKLAARKASQRP